MSTIETEIEERLATAAPDVEVLLAEVVGNETLRLYIDHPDGVTLALCEQVSRSLGDIRDRYALEVSSPGSSRPLTKPHHFNRYLGRRAKLRLREARDDRAPSAKRTVNVTGELVGASDREVTIALGEGIVAIPYEQIVRSNLVPGD